MDKLELIIREEYKKLITENISNNLLDNHTFKWGRGPRSHGLDKAASGWQSDQAYDIMAPEDTPVHSIGAGTVVKTSFAKTTNKKIYGWHVTIDSPDDINNTIFYTHLGKLAPNISAGAKVQKGQLIGWIGRPEDRSWWSDHVHIGVKRGDLKDIIDDDGGLKFDLSKPALGSKSDLSKPGLGSKSDSSALWSDAPDWVDYAQTAMDWLGFIPGYGDIIDLINASIYFARGKYIDGFISLIAVIPFVGSVVSKGLRAGFKGIRHFGLNTAMKAAVKGSPDALQKLWVKMLKEGKLDRTTMKTLINSGDEVLSLLNKSTKKLKQLDKATGMVPDAVYKSMDDLALIIRRISPNKETISMASKLAKGTGKYVVKPAGKVVKGVLELPIKLVLSPVTIPINMMRAAMRSLTPSGVTKAMRSIRRVTGKSVSQVAEMERAIRYTFKSKMAANPLLFANIVKTNGWPLLSSFKSGHKLHKFGKPGGKLFGIADKPIKEIERTITGMLRNGDLSKGDYKKLLEEVTAQASQMGNPYYTKYIGTSVTNWATGHSPFARFASAWDTKPFTQWMKPGLKSYDVALNELQDLAEQLGLKDKDDPQGVLLQGLVVALRGAGMLDDEGVEAIRKTSREFKPIYTGLKKQLEYYATLENAKSAAKHFKAYTYDSVPGLNEANQEIPASLATTKQKWNYLSTHSKEFAADTWDVIKFVWDMSLGAGGLT